MTDLAALIEQAIGLKTGNQEFVLYRHGPANWSAGIGNPATAVCLMESSPDFDGEGSTPEAAVEDLLKNLRAGLKR